MTPAMHFTVQPSADGQARPYLRKTMRGSWRIACQSISLFTRAMRIVAHRDTARANSGTMIASPVCILPVNIGMAERRLGQHALSRNAWHNRKQSSTSGGAVRRAFDSRICFTSHNAEIVRRLFRQIRNGCSTIETAPSETAGRIVFCPAKIQRCQNSCRLPRSHRSPSPELCFCVGHSLNDPRNFPPHAVPGIAEPTSANCKSALNDPHRTGYRSRASCRSAALVLRHGCGRKRRAFGRRHMHMRPTCHTPV